MPRLRVFERLSAAGLLLCREMPLMTACNGEMYVFGANERPKSVFLKEGESAAITRIMAVKR